MRNYAILLYYDPRVKYSVNALTAVLDKSRYWDVYLVRDLSKIIELAHKLSKIYNKVVIGISFNTLMLTEERFLKTLILLNKSKPYNVVSVAGGPHPTGDPVGCIEKLEFDYVVVGEGERSFIELLEALFLGMNDPYKVKGVFTKYEDRYVFPGRQEPIDLDEYHPFPFWRNLCGAIEITRGCPYGCFYCQVSYMHGFRPRHRSIESIVYYAELMAKHGFKDIRFITPNGLGYGLKRKQREPNIEIIEELLSRLYDRVVKVHGGRIFYGTFPSEVRPEHLTKEAIKVLKKYVANKNIIIGAQSGSNRILKAIGRDHTIEDVFNAVEIALKNNFIPDVDFILGLPGETREDIEETISSMKKLVNIGARIHLHVFMPLPGTPYSAKKPGAVPGWVRKEILKFIGKGAAYGQWMKQEIMARKIYELRKKGIISYGSNNN